MRSLIHQMIPNIVILRLFFNIIPNRGRNSWLILRHLFQLEFLVNINFSTFNKENMSTFRLIIVWIDDMLIWSQLLLSNKMDRFLNWIPRKMSLKKLAIFQNNPICLNQQCLSHVFRELFENMCFFIWIIVGLLFPKIL